MTSDEKRIADAFAEYEPAQAKLGKALRAKMRARLPGLTEVVYVYENQGALVIAYSPSGKGYEAPLSLAVYPDRVTLAFGRGAELAKADPTRLLQGRGKTVRHVVLEAASDFDRADVQALITAALALSNVHVGASAPSTAVFKAEEQKQRALRAAKKKRAAATSSKTKPASRTRKTAPRTTGTGSRKSKPRR